MGTLQKIARRFAKTAPRVEHWTLRLVDDRHETVSVRQDVLEPMVRHRSTGAMITVIDAGGHGYAATSDLTATGLREAAERASTWAHRTAALGLLPVAELRRPSGEGRYATPVEQSWYASSLEEKIALAHAACRTLGIDARIVDWQASIGHRDTDTLFVSGDGARVEQSFHYLHPSLVAVANEGSNTQRRTHGGEVAIRQGGLEQLERIGFTDEGRRVAEDALALLDAPECPAGTRDLVLMPEQMVLQIHESVGHPIELDRILGDERNYAGSSFVTPEMFGTYAYGSELLNVTFDPNDDTEVASYGYDDDGFTAEREYVIRAGVLLRPLGGAVSQVRAGLPGVACARACDWNRPPIDRMANLNLEPGTSTLDELVAGVERGVLMDTNRSWSIDHRRMKFQFGCEYGRRIENGELAGLVRNPSYRGLTTEFWHRLAGVGDASTRRVLGAINCGKGEPNQAIHVGHASPACLFRNVEVFGGT